MKKLLYSLLLAAVVMPLTSCSDNDVTVVNVPSARGTVTDDMGNTYDWVRIGDLEWTTSNARNGESIIDFTYPYYGKEYYLFSDEEVAIMESEYIPVKGNLMTYADALASAPDGWRLPSDEDWKNLERNLGMTDADNRGWRGEGVASRLMDKGGAEIGLMLGGNIRSQLLNDGNYSYDFDSNDECGYYWSSTIEPSYADHEMAYFRKLVSGVDKVERQCTVTESLFSVRWCRDATND